MGFKVFWSALKTDRHLLQKIALILLAIVGTGIIALVVPMTASERAYRHLPPATTTTPPTTAPSPACTPANLTKAVRVMDYSGIDTLKEVACAHGWAIAEGRLWGGHVVANLFGWSGPSSGSLGWIFYGDFAFNSLAAHARHFGMPAKVEMELLKNLKAN
jgi:hypothetical protein